MNKLVSIVFLLMGIECFAQSTKQVLYLSGTDNLHTNTWKFFCTGGRNSGKWTTIQVPSCWELLIAIIMKIIIAQRKY